MSESCRAGGARRKNGRSILLLFFLHSWPVLLGVADRGDDLLPLIQSEALKAHIIALQENIQHAPKRIVYRTRSAYHRDAANNAAQYIAEQFRRSPRLQVKFEDFGGMRNVVAKLPPRPSSMSHRIFIVCAHYDTKADRDLGWNPLTSPAPGANDNGTGVAAMLEIAQLLSQFDYDHELRFIAFDAEEIGLLGSRHHAHKAARAGENIAAVINIDMVGFNWKADLVEAAIDDRSIWIADALAIANDWYDIGLTIRRSRDSTFAGSDHKPFWDNDYRAVTLVESVTPWRDSQDYEANPFFHTSRDTIDKVNLQLTRKVTALVLVTVNSLASRSFQQDAATLNVSIDAPLSTGQNPAPITGRFDFSFPVWIIVDPGQVIADVDRVNQTYSAAVFLRAGANVIRITIIDALSARSVEQTIQFTPEFEWESALVFPNPSRQSDVLTVFRAEGNQPMEKMTVFVYAADGALVKTLSAVADRFDRRVWRVWWNHQTVLGLPVAAGIYVCRFEAEVNGETFSTVRKLAIIR